MNKVDESAVRTRTETVTSSQASAEAKNQARSLGTVANIIRQVPGDYPDLALFSKSVELGCLEIGLTNKGSHGTKELQERGLKTPRMLKSYAMHILNPFPSADLANVETVGIAISGSVALLSESPRLKLPETIEEVQALLPPVLTIIYNYTQTLKTTARYIEEISSIVPSDPSLEPIFVTPSVNGNKKRKSTSN
ncbi:unnamed protein product [Mucor hiemalis]